MERRSSILATQGPHDHVGFSGINYAMKRLHDLDPERSNLTVDVGDPHDEYAEKQGFGAHGVRRKSIIRNDGVRFETGRRGSSVFPDLNGGSPLTAHGYGSPPRAVQNNSYWSAADSLLDALSTSSTTRSQRRTSWVFLAETKPTHEVPQAQAEYFKQLSNKNLIRKQEPEPTEERIRDAKLAAKLLEVQEFNRKIDDHPWEAEKRRAAAERQKFAARPAIYQHEPVPFDPSSNLLKAIKNVRERKVFNPGADNVVQQRPKEAPEQSKQIRTVDPRNRSPDPLQRQQSLDAWEASLAYPGMTVGVIELPKPGMRLENGYQSKESGQRGIDQNGSRGVDPRAMDSGGPKIADGALRSTDSRGNDLGGRGPDLGMRGQEIGPRLGGAELGGRFGGSELIGRARGSEVWDRNMSQSSDSNASVRETQQSRQAQQRPAKPPNSFFLPALPDEHLRKGFVGRQSDGVVGRRFVDGSQPLRRSEGHLPPRMLRSAHGAIKPVTPAPGLSIRAMICLRNSVKA